MPVHVEPHGNQLPAANSSKLPWAETGGHAPPPWAKEQCFDPAKRDDMAAIKLPERPEDKAAYCFIIKACRNSAQDTEHA